MNFFNVIGRYFWLLCLGISAYNYVVGMRSLSLRDSSDPRTSAEAIALRRWFAVFSALPWVVMGWAIIFGGVPNVWYFFRPQDRDPFVLAWFATMFLMAVYFAYWVFFRGGAEKVVLLQPIDIHWHRTTFSGTRRGTFDLTVGRVKFFAVFGPLWIVAWVFLVSLQDIPLPK